MNGMDEFQRQENERLRKLADYPSPENVVAQELLQFDIATKARRRVAARITQALRDAGWRILR